MYIIEQEINEQFSAIIKTVDSIVPRCAEIREFFSAAAKLVVIGCGSSYSVAKSTALQFSQWSGLPAVAIAAGDLLVNMDEYTNILSGATVIALSRSGSTSEVVRAVKTVKERFGCRCASICACENSPMEEIADINFLILWAFDKAVCQTRTVSNLYLAGALLAAIASENDTVLSAAKRVEASCASFCPEVDELVKAIGNGAWEQAVVLADSGIAGLAEEGALAFKEICRRNSNHYHVLDVRHGPMVQIDKKTLVIAVLSQRNFSMQADLVRDIALKTDHLLVMSANAAVKTLDNCMTICLPDCGTDAVNALFMLYCIQWIALQHALKSGVNPDAPEGLDPWIKL